MKTLTVAINAIQTHNAQGQPIVVAGVPKAIIHTVNGLQVWAPKAAIGEKAEMVTYKLNEKGDTFVANRDSKSKDKEGNPLYLKGDTVTRDAESLEFVSVGQQTVTKFTSEEAKLAFLVAAGAKFTV